MSSLNPLSNIESAIKSELLSILSMSPIEVFNKIGLYLYRTDEGSPIYCKTNFKQQIVVSEPVEFKTTRAWVNEANAKEAFFKSNLIDYLFNDDEFLVDNRKNFNKHFCYGLSPSEGVFISNIEIILIYLRNKLLLEEKDYLYASLDEMIDYFKGCYRSQLLLYTPVFPSKTQQNQFQKLSEALNNIFRDVNKTTNHITAVCSIVYYHVLTNDEYKNEDISWLRDQAMFLPSFMAKRSYMHFLEVEDTLRYEYEINPGLIADFKLRSPEKSVSIIKMLLKNFIEFQAARIIYEGNPHLIDLIKHDKRTIGKLVESFAYMGIKSHNEPRFEDFKQYMHNIVKSRLALNQKFNN